MYIISNSTSKRSAKWLNPVVEVVVVVAQVEEQHGWVEFAMFGRRVIW